MRAIWEVPIIASILILGVIGLPQDVFSQTIDTDVNDNVEVGPGESATITNEAIVSGNVIVDGGTVTINGDAVITGNIQVTNGGSLSMDDITVLGNVIVEDGISAPSYGSRNPIFNFKVLPDDPHGFDGDGNGIGCES